MATRRSEKTPSAKKPAAEPAARPAAKKPTAKPAAGKSAPLPPSTRATVEHAAQAADDVAARALGLPPAAKKTAVAKRSPAARPVAAASRTALPFQKHLTLEEREAAGKAQRAAVPLEALGVWEPKPDRADPVAIITAQEADRLKPLLPVRHARMLQNAFGFYRGAPAVMAADLARRPSDRPRGAAVRGRPPAQLRPVRLAGALAGLRRQRLRRDTAGAVRVGRETTHRQPRRRRSRQRSREEEGAGHRARGAPARTATSCAGSPAWTR